MSPLPSGANNYFYPYKITPPKCTEDNFYEVQTTTCTKTLNKTDTIHRNAAIQNSIRTLTKKNRIRILKQINCKKNLENLQDK